MPLGLRGTVVVLARSGSRGRSSSVPRSLNRPERVLLPDWVIFSGCQVGKTLRNSGSRRYSLGQTPN